MVKGAGWLLVESKEKEIWVWGGRSEYEEPDYAEVKKLLSGAYPNYNIIIVRDLLVEHPTISVGIRRQLTRIERDSINLEYPYSAMGAIRKLLAAESGQS